MNTLKELWTDNDKEAKEYFDKYGIFLGNSFISLGWATKMANFAKVDVHRVRNDAVGSLGERGKYWVISGPNVRKIWPESDLKVEYDWFVQLAQAVSGDRKVIKSPYSLSDVNFKVYGPGDTQGVHYDSQPLSALLFLTNGSPLEIKLLTGEWVKIDPQPCMYAIFKGREMPHRVLPGETTRVSMPFNLYYEDDQDRPDWIDEAIYSNKDYVDAES